jgi:hypothetical protein
MLEDRILLFDTPMDTRSYFFEIYRQLWARALKNFVTPGLDPSRKGKRETDASTMFGK